MKYKPALPFKEENRDDEQTKNSLLRAFAKGFPHERKRTIPRCAYMV